MMLKKISKQNRKKYKMDRCSIKSTHIKSYSTNFHLAVSVYSGVQLFVTSPFITLSARCPSALLHLCWW